MSAELQSLTAAILFLPFIFVTVSAKAENPKFTNRLAKEKSPYLLQHAHNPVEWYPWGEEAFVKAKKENKPVILSIGYSTCHWCHVMEKESFEDEKTAEAMNRDFVSIKVDREERPDLDSVYMKYVMATTGGGGWPMTVFLTPDRKPFYGGTYFPPEDRYGMPGFKNLLSGIAEAWKTRRKEITDSADSAIGFLKNKVNTDVAASSVPGPQIFKEYFESCAASFDTEWGGFGRAPKFPRSHALSLLLRFWKKTGDDRALEMAKKTLNSMAAGGIQDHLGGGFHRYSTDQRWLVPHFEKMLYDQALISVTYLEAYQATHQAAYAEVARQTFDYVLGSLRDSQGGFYSAEDADSADPQNLSQKKEGAYYVWEQNEVDKLLGNRELKIFSYRFGVKPEGNALSDPHGELKGKNTLYEAHSLEEAAAHFGLPSKEIQEILNQAKRKLLEARKKRPLPHRDDKVLTDWNGLMIYALSLGARVLGDERYLETAVKAGEFVSARLTQTDGRLLHRYREGESGITGHLDDYAFVIYGYLGLYQATFEEIWLQRAKKIADKMIEFFYDEAEGGFYLTAKDAEELIARPKELYDGAIPSGNSLAVLDLLLLERVTGDVRYGKAAEGSLKGFAREITIAPAHYPQMLLALDFALGPADEILFAGDAKDLALEAMLKEIYLRFLPNKIIMLHEPGQKGSVLSPSYEAMGSVGGKLTVYVCHDRACRLPATDVEGLKKVLDSKT